MKVTQFEFAKSGTPCAGRAQRTLEMRFPASASSMKLGQASIVLGAYPREYNNADLRSSLHSDFNQPSVSRISGQSVINDFSEVYMRYRRNSLVGIDFRPLSLNSVKDVNQRFESIVHSDLSFSFYSHLFLAFHMLFLTECRYRVVSSVGLEVIYSIRTHVVVRRSEGDAEKVEALVNDIELPEGSSIHVHGSDSPDRILYRLMEREHQADREKKDLSERMKITEETEKNTSELAKMNVLNKKQMEDKVKAYEEKKRMNCVNFRPSINY
ncbi:hypothetical protein PRIPAC_97807 [Pristionchus pacificus]|uniref:Uncharacterized protein n=1 Tax=Pristionchus pacificus TaxID=54126 RepID=A0A2A6B2L9_PRIPA|nr:hypothetical protein PRIPAC_97807 [Pristionchus pacificus]|eukprot:PDM60116.1 hypothetical protein PRIPAC_49402 [Pristionchus pacificus]